MEEQGRIFTVKLGPQNVAVLIGPEYHRRFYGDGKEPQYRHAPKFLRASFGEVFFMAGHDEYVRQSRLLPRPSGAKRWCALHRGHPGPKVAGHAGRRG